MKLETLYELQFSSCLLKDSACFDPETADWSTVCYCFDSSALSDFVKSLEMVDQFKSDLCSATFSDEFRLNYYYRVIPTSKKFLVL